MMQNVKRKKKVSNGNEERRKKKRSNVRINWKGNGCEIHTNEINHEAAFMQATEEKKK